LRPTYKATLTESALAGAVRSPCRAASLRNSGAVRVSFASAGTCGHTPPLTKMD